MGGGIYDIFNQSKRDEFLRLGQKFHQDKSKEKKEPVYTISERVSEMLRSSNPELKELGKTLREEEILRQRIGLHTVRLLQEKHPELILTGSAALYLYGIRLKRFEFEDTDNDLDFVTNYPVHIDETSYHHRDDTAGFKDKWLVEDKATKLGKRKLEIATDPTQRYQWVELDGVRYKVSPLLDIWAWKIEYAKAGKDKHKQDLEEAMGIKPLRNIEWEEKQQAEKLRLEKERSWTMSGS